MSVEGQITIERIAAKGLGKGSGNVFSSPQTPTEMPNTLRSVATARIVEVLSEGVIAGLHAYATGGNFWQSVYLDGTPVADSAGNMQFNIKAADFRFGYPEQDALTGFSAAEAPFSVGVTTQYNVPIVRKLTAPTINAVRYIIQIPALYTQESDGDVVGASVGYAFDIRIDGGQWINAVTERISGKTMSPYQRAVRVQLPPATNEIEIRLTRLDPDTGSGTQAGLIFAAYTEIVDSLMAYDDTSVVSMAIDAREFPNVPQRGYLIDGIMLQVPSNYNGRTHGYVGDWDGSFVTQWTNNPAWVVYGLLTNKRWGIGDYIDAAAVDKWSFYEAAIFNDQAVPDGRGGIEVRWTCNCVINTRQDAWQVMTAIASSMMSSLYYSNGTVFLVQDRRVTTPERLFGPADIEGGLFDYMGADYRSKWTAVAVTWNDPDDAYNAAVELVQDPNLIATQGYRETQITAFGCTSRGQAIRVGRWYLYTSQYEQEAVTFYTGLENADVRPGAVIAIDDPSRSGARLAGRLLDDDGADTMTLDRLPPEMRQGGWTIFVTAGSAGEGEKPTVHECAVLAVIGENQIRVAGKPAGAVAGSMWLARSGHVEPTMWRVNSISEEGVGRYKILATEYHVEKWDYVDNGWNIAPPSFSLFPTGPLAGPTNLTKTEYIYLDANGTPQFGCVMAWTASIDPRASYYQLEMSGPRGEYRIYRHLTGVTQEVAAMSQGEWTAQLRAFDNIGRRSNTITLTFTPIGLTEKPLPPTTFYAIPQGGNLLTLTWTPTNEIDVVFYWIKWSKRLTGATWNTASTSIARVNHDTTQVNTPLRAGTYMLKAIDSLGQESDEWIEVIVEKQQNERVVELYQQEQPAWAGDPGTEWTVNRDELWLARAHEGDQIPPGPWPGYRGTATGAQPTKVGLYTFDGMLDLGAVTSVTMTGLTEAYGDLIPENYYMSDWPLMSDIDPIGVMGGFNMASWVPLAIARPLDPANSPYWDIYIEARVSQDGVTYGEWFPLKSAVITGRAFQWRLVGLLYDYNTILRAVEAEVLVEVPLRFVQGDDVALAADGSLTVTYVAPFLRTPNVQITARQSLEPGGNIVIVESDRDHFKAQHLKANGQPAAGGSIDYVVSGYGGHS